MERTLLHGSSRRAGALAMLSLLAASAASAQPPADKPRLAVLGVQAKGLDANISATLSGLIGGEIAKLDRYQVLAEDDVRGLVAASQLAQVMGCEGATCTADMTRIASKLNAGLVVTGTVGQIGSRLVVNLTLVDARAGTVEGRASQEAPSLDELPNVVRQATLVLFGIAGRVLLWNQPEGAQVFLDERLVGTTPLKGIDLPRPGTFMLRLSHDERTPWEARVTVRPGEVTRLKVESYALRDLEEWASGRRNLGIGLLAGGLVALGGGGLLWASAVRNDSQIDALDLRKPEDVARAREISGGTFGLAAGATVATVVGVLGSGLGAWLLADNPWRRQLDGLALVPSPGGATLLSAVRF
jgi:TolB-like protein